MKKRILFLSLALVLCLGLIPHGLAVPALAAEDSSEVEIKWLYVEEFLEFCIPESYNRDYHYLSLGEGGGNYLLFNLETYKYVEEFDYMGPFSGGLAAVWKGWWSDRSCGYIDKTGKIVIPLNPEYDGVAGFSDGLAKVAKDGKYGFIDKTGKVVVPLEYDDAEDFSSGLAKVKKDGKYGFINTTGKMVVPLEYDYIGSFSDGLAKVGKGGQWLWQRKYEGGSYGFIDKTGKIVVPLEYDDAEDFSDGLARVVKKDADGNKKYGFVGKTGKVMIPLEYDDAGSFSEGLARVKKGYMREVNVINSEGLVQVEKVYIGENIVIDKTGKVVIPRREYVVSNDFSEGLAAVEKHDADGNEKYGFIDKTGKIVVTPEYDGAENFSDGLAKVRKGGWETGKYGLIDKTGKIVVPLEYDNIGSFSDGLARVEKNGKYGFIDKTGKVVVTPEYDSVGYVSDGLCYVVKDYVYGVFVNPYYVPFKDASSWALEELGKAQDVGLTEPTEGMSYDKPINREKFAEVCVKLYEALTGTEVPAATEDPFNDTDNPEVLKAYALGIINGTSADTFSPNKELNRQTAATMLKRTVDKAGVTLPSGTPVSFSDEGEISGWAKADVAAMASVDVIRGVGEGRFAPLKVATVQESIIMAMRIVTLMTAN